MLALPFPLSILKFLIDLEQRIHWPGQLPLPAHLVAAAGVGWVSFSMSPPVLERFTLVSFHDDRRRRTTFLKA